MGRAGTAVRFAIVALGLLLSACAADPGTPAAGSACPGSGAWLDPSTRLAVAEEAVFDRAGTAGIVLLGEVHDDPAQHAWQLRVISALHARGRPLVIGVEMLPRSAQPELDAWVAGRLGETRFLEAVRWSETWGHDAALYLPVFRFARDHRIPMLALNVDRSLVAKVARSGWQAVPSAERQGIGDPAPPADAYLRFLRAVFAEHAGGQDSADGGRFERFAQAQLTWDRAMAEAIAAGAASRPTATAVGIAGRGHVEHGWGIPRQLEDLGAAATVLLAMRREEACTAAPEVADAVFVLPPAAGG